MRKYGIQLPLSYCDGKPLEPEKIGQVREALLAEFGSFVVPDDKALRYDGVAFVEFMAFEILTSDPVPKKRLADFKDRLKESLQQIDIPITSHRFQRI